MNEQQSDASTQWQAVALDSIVWVGWGNDHIAYHRPSGKTNFLNASSKFLITELLSKPKNLKDVVAAIFAAEDDSGRLAQMDEMRATLERLEQLGLVSSL